MLKISVNEKQGFNIEPSEEGIMLNGKLVKPDLVRISPTSYHLLIDNRSYNLSILSQEDEKHFLVSVNGNKYRLEVKDRYDLLLHDLGMDEALAAKARDLKAPMPGLVVDVLVKEGENILKGSPLLILEAMKMENVLKAEADGLVQQILVKPKETVEKNQALIKFG